MRPRHLVVILATAVACQGCLGASAEQRRRRGTILLVAGAATTVLAVGVSRHYTGDNCHEGPGYAPGDCFLPQLGALALGVTGAVVGSVGAGNLLSTLGSDRAANDERPPPVPARTASADQAACAVWQNAYDDERDPVRRQSLLASRPLHCAAGLP